MLCLLSLNWFKTPFLDEKEKTPYQFFSVNFSRKKSTPPSLDVGVLIKIIPFGHIKEFNRKTTSHISINFLS